MSVSVIIPTYNCAEYLPKAIESVLNQSYQDTEIIVIDDGSTDNTTDIVKPYLNQVNYLRQENQGVSAARNNGLSQAKSEYIAFLDADDTWFPYKLSLQLQACKLNPLICAVFSEFSISDQTGIIKHERYVKNNYSIFDTYKLEWDGIFSNRSDLTSASTLDLQAPPKSIPFYYGGIFNSLFMGNFINTSSLLVKKSVFNEVGVFTSELRTQEDYELWLRIARKYQFAYIDLPLLLTRRRPNQLTSLSQAEEIARVSLDVIEAISTEARKTLGNETVDTRLADKYRHLASIYIANNEKMKARSCLTKSLGYKNNFLTFAYFILSYIPVQVIDLIRNALKKFVRRARKSWF